MIEIKKRILVHIAFLFNIYQLSLILITVYTCDFTTCYFQHVGITLLGQVVMTSSGVVGGQLVGDRIMVASPHHQQQQQTTTVHQQQSVELQQHQVIGLSTAQILV